MILIVCIDDKGGMLFNRRRQSKDSVLRQRVLKLTADTRLWMNAYTKGQFTEEAANITVAEDFLSRAEKGEYCFVEDADYTAALEKAEQIIVYRWNRHYPADRRFTVDLSDWKLAAESEFAGSSHEKITEEVYTR
ncbi:MAG: ribonuclease Z [Clostridia bacterium]|nr:ribonuclease Z [Clostridia bacterium]